MITADQLNEYAERIEQLREEILFDPAHDDDCRIAGPEAEQIFLQALGYLELANRTMKLAHFALMKER